MSSERGLKGNDARRVAALRRASARRKRLDDQLRAKLATQRNELVQRESVRDQYMQRIEYESGILRIYEQQIEAMMIGVDSFSIDKMNSCRMYIGVLSDRLRLLETELGKSEAQVKESFVLLAQTQREIALNMSRIDLYGEQILKIDQKHDQATSDASDEDAEETALARRFHEMRGQS